MFSIFVEYNVMKLKCENILQKIAYHINIVIL